METCNKMEYQPINRLIIKMCLPPMISMFLQYSYNMIDSMFVACINEQALAAVSLSFPITNLMNSLSVWIGVGINVLIAGYLGQKRQDKANSVVTMGLILSLSVGIIVNIIVLLTMTPYYSAFTEDSQIFEYGCIYMQICAFMQVPNMVHIAIQKMLQATGNMISPMWFQIAGVVQSTTRATEVLTKKKESFTATQRHGCIIRAETVITTSIGMTTILRQSR